MLQVRVQGLGLGPATSIYDCLDGKADLLQQVHGQCSAAEAHPDRDIALHEAVIKIVIISIIPDILVINY